MLSSLFRLVPIHTVHHHPQLITLTHAHINTNILYLTYGVLIVILSIDSVSYGT